LPYGEGDRNHAQLWAADGKPYSYDQLMDTADRSVIEKELTESKMETRYNACQQGIATLGETLEKVNPDLLILIGDDQMEMFSEENMPAVLIYWGQTLRNVPPEIPDSAPAHRKANAWGWFAPEEIEYPIASDLGLHLIEHLMSHQFEVSHSRRMPRNQGMGHAFGYVYQRILQRKPIPTVPIMVNTYYAPNQVTPERCYQLGREIRAAVESWDSDERIAIVASGGLSHFVIDEDLDNQVVRDLANKDLESLFSIPLDKLNSGNSEIRNWIATAGALEHLGMELIDYVPCYRSLAGTGCAMGFAQWT
jgi:hypothetical protein